MSSNEHGPLVWLLCNSCWVLFTGDGGAGLWGAALVESLIIPSGQSVWHSAVTFQSPPPRKTPQVRQSSVHPLQIQASVFLPVFFVLLLSNDTSLGQSHEMKLPVNTRQSNAEMGVRSLHSVFEVKFYQHRLLAQTEMQSNCSPS